MLRTATLGLLALAVAATMAEAAGAGRGALRDSMHQVQQGNYQTAPSQTQPAATVQQQQVLPRKKRVARVHRKAKKR